jgi:hypothetical protein
LVRLVDLILLALYTQCDKALDRVSPHNWLDDNFWKKKAYLEWRAPLLVNSNWWLAFHDDKLIPQSALDGESSDDRTGITRWQVRRAAWLIYRMLEFKERLDACVSIFWFLSAEPNITYIVRSFTRILLEQVSLYAPLLAGAPAKQSCRCLAS